MPNVQEHFRLNSKVNTETCVYCHTALGCHNSMMSPLKTPRMEQRIKEKRTQCKSMGLALMCLSNLTSALQRSRFLLIDYSQILFIMILTTKFFQFKIIKATVLQGTFSLADICKHSKKIKNKNQFFTFSFQEIQWRLEENIFTPA